MADCPGVSEDQLLSFWRLCACSTVNSFSPFPRRHLRLVELADSLQPHVLVFVPKQLYLLELVRLEVQLLFSYLADRFSVDSDLTSDFPYEDPRISLCQLFNDFAFARSVHGEPLPLPGRCFAH